MAPVLLTTSPSRTNLSEPKSTTWSYVKVWSWQSDRADDTYTNLAGFEVHTHALDTRGKPLRSLVDIHVCA